MRKRILIIAGIAALALTGTIYAAVRHEANRPIVDRIVGHLTRQLNLTDTQQTQVKSILESERPKVLPLLADAAKNRQQLHDLTAGGKFDEAQVRLVAAKQAQIMTDLIVEKERVKSKIYNDVLTEQQRAKADQLLQRIEAHFRDRFTERSEATVPVAP
jgi:Spy/CpxP family protein refolding chaperone